MPSLPRAVDPSEFDLDDYEVAKRIAVGGMAEVFLAWQRGPSGFRRSVAIKRALPHLVEEPESAKLFLREAAIAGRLAHRNIVSVLEVLQPLPEQLLIVMEYIEGKPLSQLLLALEGPMPTSLAGYITTSVCDALDHAYNSIGSSLKPLRIVHRDVSPANILLGVDGEVKLADFGIARALGAESFTKTGVIRGKARYMSPEQIKGEPLDQRSDIFSVGVLLYEITTGVALFKRDSEVATAHALLSDEIAPPDQHVADYPTELARIVARALERDRDKRYPKAADLAADLRSWLGKAPLAAARRQLTGLLQELFPDGDLSDTDSPAQWGEASNSKRTVVVTTRTSSRPVVAAVAEPSRPHRAPLPDSPPSPWSNPWILFGILLMVGSIAMWLILILISKP